MSRVRVAVGGVLLTGVLVGSASVALAAWPLTVVQAQVPGAGAAGPAGEGQLSVAQRQTIDVPAGLSKELTHATILMDLVVDATGVVTTARPVSLAIRNQNHAAQLSASDRRSLEALLGRAPDAPSGRRPFADGAAVMRDLDTMVQSASAALTQWRFEAPASAPAVARMPVSFDLAANTASTGQPVPLSGFAGVAGIPPSTFVARATAPAADGTLRVGGQIRPPQKIHGVNPAYPQEAKDAGVQGVVVIEAKIAADGSIAEAWVLRSIPMLDGPALEAVRQWRYEPTLLNGAPVPVIITVTVNFTLKD